MVDITKKPFHLSEEQCRWVKDTLASMTPKEKAGQLFCVAGFGDLGDILDVYEKIPFGGIMYRPNRADLIRECNTQLQAKVKVPLLVAANLEAGGSGIVTDGTFYGCQMQVAATGDPHDAYHLGVISASEAAAVGANLAFAPVVDIDFNWRNPITNIRTYGSDPDYVLACAGEYLKGSAEHNVAVSIKHFPGDGVDERDQHIVASVNSLSCEEWDESYGKVYKTLIGQGAQTVMAGHILQPAYSKKMNPDITPEEMMPATLSPELITGLLRGRLGFNGVVITDATNMVGMCCMMEREKLVPASINAGCDVFLFGRNAVEDYGYLMKAIQTGELSRERLDDAVTRILALKASLGLHEPKPYPDAAVIGCAAHQALARRCADDAVTLVKDTQHLLPVTPEKYKRIWLHVLDEPGFTDPTTCTQPVIRALKEAGFEVIYDDDQPKGLPDTQIPVAELKKSCDLILYVANVVNASYKTVTRLKWGNPAAIDAPFFTKDIPTMFISLANPYHFADVPMIRTIINSYSPSEAVIQATIEKMMGKSEFKGKSPVDPFGHFWGKDI